MIAFGTFTDFMIGRDLAEQKQWRNVWGTIRNFRYDLDKVEAIVSADRLTAVGMGVWQSDGYHPNGDRFDRPGRNPWLDTKGFRGPHEIEKPHGEWNEIEILCDHDKVSISVNGHHTLTGTNSIPSMGKILLQSEGAEVFFRRLDMYPL